MLRPAIAGTSMFATIAWASNASQRSDRDLEWVTQLLAADRPMLWVVHVAVPSAAEPRGRSDGAETRIAKLKGQVRALRGDGLAASLYVVRGADVPLGTAIAAGARAVDADLIIVGAQAPSCTAVTADARVVLDLLHAATSPVLALPLPSVRPGRETARAPARDAEMAGPGVTPA